jgi:hypothetical protein
MRAARLQDALERLTAAIRDVESELTAMKAEHDSLALHIFVSRRHLSERFEAVNALCGNNAKAVKVRRRLFDHFNWLQSRNGLACAERPVP